MMIIHKEKNTLNNLFIFAMAIVVFLLYKAYNNWVYLLGLVPILILVTFIHFRVNYFIYDEWLYVKTGFLSYKEINVFDITSISVEGKVIVVLCKDIKVKCSIKGTDNLAMSLKAINPSIEIKK